MMIIEKVINKIASFLTKNKPMGKNFFDYPSRERKKIIEKAAKNAAKMKRDTVDKYFALFS